MEELFDQYRKYLTELVSLTVAEDDSQNDIAKEERDAIAQIEKEYSQVSFDIQKAMAAVTEQYRNVWDSCTVNAGLKRPEAQRPASTDKSWQECVNEQEKAAAGIRGWLDIKKQESIAKKQRQLQEEAERRTASIINEAEAERKKKEEAKALEEAKGASFLESMKQKFRRK